MKVKPEFYSDELVELADWLDPTFRDYSDSGQVEEALRNSRLANEVIGKLLANLVEKNLVKFDEAKTLLGRYSGKLVP